MRMKNKNLNVNTLGMMFVSAWQFIHLYKSTLTPDKSTVKNAICFWKGSWNTYDCTMIVDQYMVHVQNLLFRTMYTIHHDTDFWRNYSYSETYTDWCDFSLKKYTHKHDLWHSFRWIGSVVWAVVETNRHVESLSFTRFD